MHILVTLTIVIGIVLLILFYTKKEAKKRMTASDVSKLEDEQKDIDHNNLMDKVMGVIEDAVVGQQDEAKFNPNEYHKITLTKRAKEELKGLGYILTVDDDEVEGSYVVRWKM